MTLYLYANTIDESTRTRAGSELRSQLATSGVLQGQQAPAQASKISLDPNELLLAGSYQHETYAAVLAQELEELFSADAIGAVALHSDQGDRPVDGYYTMADASVTPPRPQSEAVRKFDGTLRRVGARSTHWRAVTTAASEEGTSFGSATTEHVAAPATASKVRWYDPVEKATADPGSDEVATRTGEFGDVVVYDAATAPYADPTLIYENAYSDDVYADVRVWDTRGFASRDDGDGVPQWQKVYSQVHDYVGYPVISNGLLRLQLEEGNLRAERYTSGSWSPVSLGTSDWTLYDADLKRIGAARVEAQLEFEDNPSTGAASYHALDLVLPRGYEDGQWFRPATESSPAPSGLQTLLNPIAHGSRQHVHADKTVVERAETRR